MHARQCGSTGRVSVYVFCILPQARIIFVVARAPRRRDRGASGDNVERREAHLLVAVVFWISSHLSSRDKDCSWRHHYSSERCR